MSTKSLVIRDEIHGDMTFEGLLPDVINHECFQRLRYIKQLGLADYVFPCANHSRFQHSLGAAYLASHYFTSIVKSWLSSPFHFDARSGETVLFAQQTYECIASVADHSESREFWAQVACLAGLLHDIGHGPWSHSFEELELEFDCSEVAAGLNGVSAEYFSRISKNGGRLLHEDFSVLYTHRILSELGQEKYFLPVAALIHKRIGSEASSELLAFFKKEKLKGGLDFHRLLRPIISGPFDVDRIDYIQRDGRNCGVSIGGIEWRRIVSKLVPCLANHPNSAGEPQDVCLISNVKNQHVLDDFIFSLFQMYTQVYMHPKIVGLEEMIKRVLVKAKRGPHLKVTFDFHRSLSDEKFRERLAKEPGLEMIEDLMLRRKSGAFTASSYPANSGLDDELRAEGFVRIETHHRPMMKDSVGVFLFGSLGKKGYFFEPWAKVSPIASRFPAISYAPEIWVKAGS